MKYINPSSNLVGLLCLVWQSSVINATTYVSPPDPIPSMLQNGDVLNVVSIPQFAFIDAAVGSTINLSSGGSVYDAHVRGTLNSYVDSGGMSFGRIDGGTVNAWGGLLFHPQLENGAHVNIDGGDVLNITSRDSSIRLRSGSLGAGLFLNTIVDVYAPLGPGEFRVGDSVFNIWGGPLTPEQGTDMVMTGELRLFVQSALLGGTMIPGLSTGATVVISQRDVKLTGLLSDGTQLDVTLSSNLTGGGYKFTAGSLVRVTLVPEPGGVVLTVIALACLIKRSRGVSQF